MSISDPEKRKARDEEAQDVNNIGSTVETTAASDEIDVVPGVEGAEATTDVGVPNPNAHIKGGHDARFLVAWDSPDDPANPQNWSRPYRWWLTFFSGFITLNASFSSSAPSGVLPDIRREFGFGEVVASLMIGIFIAGYCVGPLVWGPASESYGRRPMFVISFWMYSIFQLACAVAPNTGALLAFRFFGGCFAASPLTNAGALLADIWDAKTRGKAMALFTVAPFAGPALGPIVSGFIHVSGTSWRILFWVLFAFVGACAVAIMFILPETYGPILLKHKAERKRKETGDVRWHAHVETIQISRSERIKGIVFKPFKMLFLEPMLMAITLYTCTLHKSYALLLTAVEMAFLPGIECALMHGRNYADILIFQYVYGVLYLCFEAFPIIYSKGHGFNAGLEGLVFLPLFIGGGIGCLLTIFYYNPKYSKLVDQYAPKHVPPEARLPMGAVGACSISLSLFWIGWTSFPTVSVWAPIIGGLPLGIGVTLIFVSLLNYIVDVYLQVAASALAANTVLRSVSGAVFPLFATNMYEKLNPRWASTLLGCLALLMTPMPLVFIRYGPHLRAMSKFAPTGRKPVTAS